MESKNTDLKSTGMNCGIFIEIQFMFNNSLSVHGFNTKTVLILTEFYSLCLLKFINFHKFSIKR